MTEAIEKKASAELLAACAPTAVTVVRTLQDAGFETYLAGGCVRDLLRGITPADYDIATAARPDDVQALFAGAIGVGKAFGVMLVHADSMEFEIATFRKDHAYSDGRRPDAVDFSDSAEDALRRDLTINALFLDPVAGLVIDHVNGLVDLDAGIVRAVGDPTERFAEDHLRIMRAVRFAASMDFKMDEQTAESIKLSAPNLARIAEERIRIELSRTLVEARRAGEALRRMLDLGILEVVMPELIPMVGQEQPPQFHPEGDVFTHTAMMLDMMDTESEELAYAVLLHDVGKPPTAMDDNGRIRFNNHGRVGAGMADTILRRLRMSNDKVDAICFMINNHMRFMHVQEMRKSTLRKLMGAPTFELELELHKLDCEACICDLSNYDFLVEKMATFEPEQVLPAPWITGNDIMALGITKGPKVGKLKSKAYDQQLEGAFDDRDSLLDWLKSEIGKRA